MEDTTLIQMPPVGTRSLATARLSGEAYLWKNAKTCPPVNVPVAFTRTDGTAPAADGYSIGIHRGTDILPALLSFVVNKLRYKGKYEQMQ
jgi:hypothetical protein